MRFRELRIEASDVVSDHGLVAPGFVFRWTVHHVREIFAALLPRGYVLDGSAVVQITCGPRGGNPQYSRSGLGSSRYFAEGFDFRAYYHAPPAERDRIVLAAVESALCDIAGRSGADPGPLRATAAAVAACDFRHSAEVPKLRKVLRPSGNRVRVYRCLGREVGETWCLRVEGRGGPVLAEVAMGTTPDYLDRRDYFGSAALEGGCYVVRNRLNAETFRLDVARFNE